MLIAILKTLSCADLQTFYLMLDSLDRAGVYANSAPTTNSKNFFMTPKATSFQRRITKMVSSYGHLFVAADALEMIRGYDDEETALFRDWVGVCTAYLFDEGCKHGGPAKNQWDTHMKKLLTRSVLGLPSRYYRASPALNTAQNNALFAQQMNSPKMRAIRSTLMDDRFMWAHSKYVNDQDSERPHRIGKGIFHKNSNHILQEFKCVKHMLNRWINVEFLLHLSMGMFAGTNLNSTMGEALRHGRDTRNDNRIWSFLRKTLLLPQDGTFFYKATSLTQTRRRVQTWTRWNMWRSAER